MALPDAMPLASCYLSTSVQQHKLLNSEVGSSTSRLAAAPSNSDAQQQLQQQWLLARLIDSGCSSFLWSIDSGIFDFPIDYE